MNAPNPVPPPGMQVIPPSPGPTPTTSTAAGGIGGVIASLIIMVLGMKGITFPAGFEALLAVAVGFVASYIPPSGRQ
jgi:hypothetical protein